MDGFPSYKQAFNGDFPAFPEKGLTIPPDGDTSSIGSGVFFHWYQSDRFNRAMKW